MTILAAGEHFNRKVTTMIKNLKEPLWIIEYRYSQLLLSALEIVEVRQMNKVINLIMLKIEIFNKIKMLTFCCGLL